MPTIIPSEETRCSLRRAFGSFATGVTIVTARDAQGEAVGFTANSFTSVSLDPALLLVSISKTSSNLNAFSQANSFAVNILAASQTGLSNRFASRGEDRFSGVEWTCGDRGAPLIGGSAAWFDCTLHRLVDAGDHVIIIGRIEAFSHTDLEPLIYLKGQYLEAPRPVEVLLSDPPDGGLRAGGLLGCMGKIVLERDGDNWTVPMGSAKPGFRAARSSLDERLAEAGAEVRWNVLYSVFDDPVQPGTWMFFQGVLDEHSVLRSNFKLFAPEDIPLNKISTRGMRSMLRRYLAENREGAFSLYADGTRHSGHIARFAGTATPWSDTFTTEEETYT